MNSSAVAADPGRARFARDMLALALLRAVAPFQIGSVAAVSPLMSADLRMSATELGLLVGIYMLAGLLISIPGAAVTRRYGDLRVLCVCLVAMTAGALMLAAADGYGGALAGRAMAGCGGVIITMVTLRMASEHFAGPRAATGMAVVVASWPVGIGFALLAVGPLAQAIGWRSALLVPAVLPLAFLALRDWKRMAAPPAAPGRVPMLALQRHEWGAVALLCVGWFCYNGWAAAINAFTPLWFVEQGRSVAGAAAMSSVMMMSCAVALGVAAAVHPGLLAIALAAVVSPAGRTGAFGLFSFSANAGLLLTPVVAGALVDAAGTAGAALALGAAVAALVALGALPHRR
ncbi:MAG TPA: MFS transporter [Burkholderiaceae bacterium]|nr:MFS transporter [Burkholderiaceae bacterium]